MHFRTVLRHVYAEKYEMHDSANIDKKDPQFKSISRQKKPRKAYICFKRYTQCGDGACKKS